VKAKRIVSITGIAMVVGFASAPAGATVVYSGAWQSNAAPNGNYIFQVTDAGAVFNYSLTVNPWNAEALGLFIDLGTADLPIPSGVALTRVSPIGEVTVYATDSTSSSCGPGCNLNGLAPPARVGGDWELIFRLGDVGFDSIQTFTWTTQDFGLTESDFGIVGVRAQQLCSSTGTLDDGDEGCGDSDKVWAVPNGVEVPPEDEPIPEPGVMFLIGAGLVGLGMARRRKSA